MKLSYRLLLLLLVSASMFSDVRSSQAVLKKMSEQFHSAIEVCKKDLSYQDSDIQELYNYWKVEGQLVERTTGCMIGCLSTKLDLLDPEGNLHHGNAKEFATKHGADDAVSQQIVDLIHGCMQSAAPNTDACLQVLDVANCFKKKIHELAWAPDIEVIIEEVLAEV